jgi:hypothetical protein
MKKTMLALTLSTFTSISSANSNYINMSYSNISDVESDAYSISFATVVDNISLSLAAGVVDSAVADDYSLWGVSASVGLSSFEKGTFYARSSLSKISGTSENILGIGYALISSSQMSYDFAFLDNDTIDPTVSVTVRIPQDESTGFTFGIAASESQKQATIGISTSF